MVSGPPPVRCWWTGERRRAKAKAASLTRTRRSTKDTKGRAANVARKYLIETFGCQMNVHDSERMAGLLEQAGYEATDDASDADVVVINTCSVRERAEEKLYTRLGELRVLAAEQGHDPIVAVAGCVVTGLLEAIHDVNGIDRIRFASPHPRHFDDRFLRAMAGLPKICRHLHLPVQSGSTRVLGAMRRRYTRESYLDLVARIRVTLPDVALSTDMIVGFPGETAADFDDTLSLTATVRYHSMFSFKYSPRPNTLAEKRMADDVPEEEKTRRIVALQALQKGIQSELFHAAVGRLEPVLVDATSRRREWELSGRTSGNTVVNFPGDPAWVGQIVQVRITGANPNSLRGEHAN